MCLGQHQAIATPFESLQDLPMHDLVYADPPYTAQQYSRFYHVLEVMEDGIIPHLQTDRDHEITRGIYPEGRFASRFCSKRLAPRAFADLLHFASTHARIFALSYSQSMSEKSGNYRVISLDELRSICEPYGDVDVIEVGHSYRRFNSANANSDHREFLIVCS